MLLITMFCYLFFYTGRHNFGWAAHALATELQVSYEKIGWVSFAMLLGYAVGQFVNGNLADRFSPRTMIVTGGILSVAANLAISVADSFNLVLVLWALNGYFQSMAWAPGSRILTNWFGQHERQKAFSFYTMAASSSSTFTYLLSIMLVQQNQHWRLLFRLPVLFLLAALIVFYFVVRNKPSDMGFEDSIPARAKENGISWRQRYQTVFGNRRFLLACLSMGFESMARYTLIFWVPVYFLGKEYKSHPEQMWVSLLLPAGMAIGAYSFGHISDKLFSGNKPYAISTGMFSCALVALLIYFFPGQHGVITGLLMFMAGFFAYGPQANFWPLSPELLGAEFTGTGVGIMNMSAYLFAALGEPVMGKIIDVTGNAAMVFIAVALLAFLSSVIILFVNSSKKVLYVIS